MDDFLQDIVDCYNNHFWEEKPTKTAEEVLDRMEKKLEKMEEK